MPATLAIDCSFAGLSLAVQKGDEVYHFTTETPRSSDILATELHNLLQQAGVDVSGIGTILATVGPGSFTGIRLGLVTAQALKLLNPGIHLVGLSTLQGLAAQVRAVHQPSCAFTVLLDAAGGQTYAQSFAADGRAATEAVCSSEPTLADKVFAQASLMLANAVPLATLDARHMLHLASTQQAHLPPQPVYLKPLTYKKVQ